MAENSQAKRRRGAGRPFKKGQSGNPGGRPKDLAAIKELAQQYAPEAILRLVDWMRSDNPRASPAATQALLDRGYGKPSQSVDLAGEIRVPITWPLPKHPLE